MVTPSTLRFCLFGGKDSNIRKVNEITKTPVIKTIFSPNNEKNVSAWKELVPFHPCYNAKRNFLRICEITLLYIEFITP